MPGHHDDGKFAALAGVDLRGELRRRLGREELAIVFCNDAEAAVVAEALHGGGRSFDRVLGITLGAGMGACLVAGDAIVEASAAVLPGELYRQPFGAATADDAFSDRGLRARLGGADPARARDDGAVLAFAAFGADLGAFLAPWAEVLGADAVVVAGGIAGAYKLFGPGPRECAARAGARRRAGRGRWADRRRPRARRGDAPCGRAGHAERRLTAACAPRDRAPLRRQLAATTRAAISRQPAMLPASPRSATYCSSSVDTARSESSSHSWTSALAIATAATASSWGCGTVCG